MGRSTPLKTLLLLQKFLLGTNLVYCTLLSEITNNNIDNIYIFLAENKGCHKKCCDRILIENNAKIIYFSEPVFVGHIRNI